MEQVTEYPGLRDWVQRQAELGRSSWNDIRGPVSMAADSVVGLMLQRLPDPEVQSLSQLVRLAVDVGGDTDSSAAVLVAVASCSSEYEDDLPQVLRDGLENGEFGRDYLLIMDAQLARLPAFYQEVM
jgi:hypothetical protein